MPHTAEERPTRHFLIASALVLGSCLAARAKVLFFNATCGGGKEAKLTKLGSDAIDVCTNPDPTVTASRTGNHGANGISLVEE